MTCAYLIQEKVPDFNQSNVLESKYSMFQCYSGIYGSSFLINLFINTVSHLLLLFQQLDFHQMSQASKVRARIRVSFYTFKSLFEQDQVKSKHNALVI